MSRESMSGAYEKGREDALLSRSNRLRSNASARWQIQYQVGWAAGHTEAANIHAEWLAAAERSAPAGLLPCPFCGKQPLHAYNALHRVYVVWCATPTCPARPEIDTYHVKAAVAQKEATRRWNTRPEPQP